MKKSVVSQLPRWLRRLNQRLNERGFELKKRQVYVIEPIGKGVLTEART